MKEAELYTKPDRGGRKSWTHTNLYVNFCSAARIKIGKMINDAKKNHEEAMRLSNSNQATQWMKNNYMNILAKLKAISK